MLHRDDCGVSILVVLEIVLEDQYLSSCTGMRAVSILVVLEIVLEDPVIIRIFVPVISFNPCCVGNSSGRP